MVGHSPSDFWDSSLQEIYAIITGFREFHGADQKEAPMTRDRMNELIEVYYPDHG